jgi:hypothetical protein
VVPSTVKPPPARRLRRALLLLSYSTTISRLRNTTTQLAVGRIVGATVKSVIERTDGLHLQVDYGHDQTALVNEWQVVR